VSHRPIAFALALALPSLASAGALYDQGLVLRAAGGVSANGVNAPSVVAVEDGAGGYTYRMYFETTVATRAGCGTTWAIGMATSTDAVNWTASRAPVLSAGGASWYGCAIRAREPTFEDDTRTSSPPISILPVLAGDG
jgi:hypothetical protein